MISDSNEDSDTPDDAETTDHPDQAFNRYILYNPEICSWCFARIRSWEPAPDGPLRTSIEGIVTGTSSVAHSGEWCFPPSSSGSSANPGKRVVCRECGTIDPRDEARPVRTAINHTHALIARLREQDIRVDADAVYDTVRERKSTPKTASRDIDTFRVAVDAGIRAASWG